MNTMTQEEVRAEQERQLLINELERVMKSDKQANQSKVAITLNAMRDSREWKVEKITEILEMAKKKNNL